MLNILYGEMKLSATTEELLIAVLEAQIFLGYKGKSCCMLAYQEFAKKG